MRASLHLQNKNTLWVNHQKTVWKYCIAILVFYLSQWSYLWPAWQLTIWILYTAYVRQSQAESWHYEMLQNLRSEQYDVNSRLNISFFSNSSQRQLALEKSVDSVLPEEEWEKMCWNKLGGTSWNLRFFLTCFCLYTFCYQSKQSKLVHQQTGTETLRGVWWMNVIHGWTSKCFSWVRVSVSWSEHPGKLADSNIPSDNISWLLQVQFPPH